MSTWIYLLQIAHGIERVGAVTSATTRYLDLGQHLLRFLKNGDVHIGAHFLEVNGQEESSRTSTYYRSFHFYILTFLHFLISQ